jgi:hypothetical protein
MRKFRIFSKVNEYFAKVRKLNEVNRKMYMKCYVKKKWGCMYFFLLNRCNHQLIHEGIRRARVYATVLEDKKWLRAILV